MCKELEKCKIKRECTYENMFDLPQCCPPTLCDPKCVKEKDCDPVDPPTECVWGYRLGDLISETISEVAQKKIINEGDALNYFKCYTSTTTVQQSISM